MRNMLPIGCLAMALAGAAYGQTPRLRFVDLPSPDHAIMGRVTLHVSDDPITRPARSRVVIRLDGALIAECYRLPLDLAWETDGIEDGRHLLQLVLIEERGGRAIDRILDERTITIRSQIKPARPSVPAGPERSEPKPPRRPESVDRPAPAGDSAPGRGVPFGAQPAPAQPASAQPANSPAQVRTEAGRQSVTGLAELSALNATTVALSGRKLCIGLADGGLTIYDTADGKGTRIAGPPAAGETRAVALGSKGILWWLCAPTVAAPLAALLVAARGRLDPDL
jgi:hypothetical protein